MGAFVLGNVFSAMAGSYGMLMLSRFLTGLPHGAYFGVASLVAANMASPERRGRAVAMVMLGLSVANVVGVRPPPGWARTSAGARPSGRSACSACSPSRWSACSCPPSRATPTSRPPGALRVTGRQVWLTLLVGVVGFGGMFAIYTYIAPTVTGVAGLSEGAVPVFLLAFGLGMVFGTWLAGEMADWSVFGSLFTGRSGWPRCSPSSPSWRRTAGVTAAGLRDHGPAGPGGEPPTPADGGRRRAQTLGAALNHASLNVANALGAWLGGLVIAAGWGYRHRPWSASRCRWRACWCWRCRSACIVASASPEPAGHPGIAIPGFSDSRLARSTRP